jgi:hypothetical protein
MDGTDTARHTARLLARLNHYMARVEGEFWVQAAAQGLAELALQKQLPALAEASAGKVKDVGDATHKIRK